RINAVSYSADGAVESAMPYQPMPLADVLRNDLPEIQHTTRLFESQHVIRKGTSNTSGTGSATVSGERTSLFADPSFFDIFTFPLKQGEAATALDELNSIVLGKRAAREYFGDVDPVGRTLQIRFEDDYE